MTFLEAVQSFLTYCELERALSPNTLIAYADDLKHFGRFAAENLGADFTPPKSTSSSSVASSRACANAVCASRPFSAA